jgi:hypothetical protein
VRLANDRGGPDTVRVVVVGLRPSGTAGMTRQAHQLFLEIAALVVLVAVVGAIAVGRLGTASAPARPVVAVGVRPVINLIGGLIAASDSLTLGHVPSAISAFVSTDLPVDITAPEAVVVTPSIPAAVATATTVAKPAAELIDDSLPIATPRAETSATPVPPAAATSRRLVASPVESSGIALRDTDARDSHLDSDSPPDRDVRNGNTHSESLVLSACQKCSLLSRALVR